MKQKLKHKQQVMVVGQYHDNNGIWREHEFFATVWIEKEPGEIGRVYLLHNDSQEFNGGEPYNKPPGYRRSWSIGQDQDTADTIKWYPGFENILSITPRTKAMGFFTRIYS